jgi:hypothetical protein
MSLRLLNFALNLARLHFHFYSILLSLWDLLLRLNVLNDRVFRLPSAINLGWLVTTWQPFLSISKVKYFLPCLLPDHFARNSLQQTSHHLLLLYKFNKIDFSWCALEAKLPLFGDLFLLAANFKLQLLLFSFEDTTCNKRLELDFTRPVSEIQCYTEYHSW